MIKYVKNKFNSYAIQIIPHHFNYNY